LTRIQLTMSHVSYHFCLPLHESPASLYVNYYKVWLFLYMYCDLNGGTKRNILGTLYTVSCPPTGSDFCRQRQDCRCTISSIKQCSSIFTFIDIGQEAHISVQVSQRYFFDSVHISFLLCRIREIYLCLRTASNINTFIFMTFFWIRCRKITHNGLTFSVGPAILVSSRIGETFLG
jgi:hypothetical protein